MNDDETKAEPRANVLSMLNRQQRRVQEATERAGRSEVDEVAERLARLGRVQHMLMALIRPHGRVRIPRADLDAITTGARLGVQVQDNGDLVVTLLG